MPEPADAPESAPPPGAPADLARAEATLFAARKPSRKINRAGCLGVFLFLGFLSLAGLVWLCWCDEPTPTSYSPAAPRSGETTVRLGKGYAIRLPAGWSESREFLAFQGPTGFRLTAQHGTVMFFEMCPATLSGGLVANTYTAPAYANRLPSRIDGLGAPLKRNLFTLGKYTGAEAAFLREDGSTFRAFAVVDADMHAIELRFTFPSGPGSPNWAEAEKIFATLGPPPPEPAAPPASGTTATPVSAPPSPVEAGKVAP